MADLRHQLKRPKSLTEQALHAIRTRIVRGDFELGAPLSENALALELGVSKTPIREALLQLKMEGLVEIKPQRGTFVFDMSREEIVQLGEFRQFIETKALQLAIERNRGALTNKLSRIVEKMIQAVERSDWVRYRVLDAEYHQAIIDHCGNVYFQNCYANFAYRVQAIRTRLSATPELNQRSLADHCGLVDLLRDKRLEEAETYLCKHVTDATANYIETTKTAREPIERD